MRILLFPLFAAVFFIEGCNTFYATANPHLPVMRGKNDFFSSASAGGGGLNGAVSWSPCNHVYTGGAVHYYPSESYNKHISAGPHIGYYHNNADTDFYFSIQVGFTWGNVFYANSFTSEDVDGPATYASLHTQFYVSNRMGRRGNTQFIFCLYADPVRMKCGSINYSSTGPETLAQRAVITGACISFQHSLRSYHPIRFFWTGGFQYGFAESGMTDDLALNAMFRVGIIYQVQFSQGK